MFLGLTVAAYAGVVDNGFCLDDTGIVIDNRFVGAAAWGKIWTTSYWHGVTGEAGGLYRPLTLSLITLERLLFDGRAMPYHVVSVLLQVLAGACLAAAARRTGLSRATAWSAGALLCVHPAASEVVNAVVGTADLLAFIGGVTGASILVTSRSPRATLMAAAVVLMAALAKESAAVFAVGAFVAHLLHHRRPLPLLCASLCLVLPVALRATLTGHLDPGSIGFLDNPLAYAGVVTRWLNAPALAVRYLLIVIFPWPLSADYSFDAVPVIAVTDMSAWLPPLLLCGSVGVLIWLLVHRHPRATLWCASGIAMLALSAHVVVPIGTIYAERLAYPLLAGAGIGAALLLDDLRRRRGARTGWLLTGTWLLLFMALDRHRTVDWHDDGTLFASALQISDRSARAHYGWGRWQQQQGDHGAAIGAYQKALRIHARYPDALYNQGAALVSLGRYPEALMSYEAAYRARPGHVKALFAVAVVREALDDSAATRAYTEVLDLQPHHAEAARGAARCLAASGEMVAARAVLQRAFGATAAAEWERLSVQRAPQPASTSSDRP
jgi:hypothetical protein